MTPRQAAGPRVVVLGDINADLTWTLPAYPAEGDDCTAQGVRIGSGGAGLNAAVVFARLGAQVRLLGRVGRDPVAAVALQVAEASGVDLTGVQQDEEVATGLCSAAVGPNGQRTFFSFRGANVRFDPAAIRIRDLEDVDLLYLSSHALLEGQQQRASLRLLELAREREVPVALDLGLPAIRRCRQLIDELLPRLWLLSLNGDELAALLPGTPTTLALGLLLARVQRGHVVLKRGADGCSAAALGGDWIERRPPEVTVCDTTGCGDAFAAAFAWARLQERTLEQAATLANLLGALTATRPGSADALPSTEELATHGALA